VNRISSDLIGQVEVNMKWTLNLCAEPDPVEATAHEIASGASVKPASLGTSIEESKQIAANIQAKIVSDQVVRHKGSDGLPLFCQTSKDEGVVQVDL
jgi:hypothetical protein